MPHQLKRRHVNVSLATKTLILMAVNNRTNIVNF